MFWSNNRIPRSISWMPGRGLEPLTSGWTFDHLQIMSVALLFGDWRSDQAELPRHIAKPYIRYVLSFNNPIFSSEILEMNPNDFFAFSSSVILVLLAIGLVASFVYEYYSKRRQQ